MEIVQETTGYATELKELLAAFDNYIWNGNASLPELDVLLTKHGFDLKEPIGIVDIITGYCERYNLEARFNKDGSLQIKHTKQS